jgi:hypothetical protein
MKKFSLWLFKIMYKEEIEILNSQQVSLANEAWKAGARNVLINLDLFKRNYDAN